MKLYSRSTVGVWCRSQLVNPTAAAGQDRYIRLTDDAGAALR
jgi:hypothetical protein